MNRLLNRIAPLYRIGRVSWTTSAEDSRAVNLAKRSFSFVSALAAGQAVVWMIAVPLGLITPGNVYCQVNFNYTLADIAT
jgi:hypothetical protein